MNKIIANSILICPECGHKEMPTDACQWFYMCISFDLLQTLPHGSALAIR